MTNPSNKQNISPVDNTSYEWYIGENIVPCIRSLSSNISTFLRRPCPHPSPTKPIKMRF